MLPSLMSRKGSKAQRVRTGRDQKKPARYKGQKRKKNIFYLQLQKDSIRRKNVQTKSLSQDVPVLH